ncbi:MAG TPA: hypothetical protein VH234_05790 [Candidatus Saccharimonadales bacterium]|jgi:hypothetical protein|nr:hypothetical protein [Candidatus Saccharimonadales bacterium]
MSDAGEQDHNRISFVYPEGLSDKEKYEASKRLANYAIKHGFKLEGRLPIFGPDIELENHYQETYPPRARADFMAKEHFWRAGEEVGLDRRTTGALFGLLAYPLKAKTQSWQADEVVEPRELGLEIRHRDDARIPHPPKWVNLRAGGLTKSQLLHIKKGGLALPPESVVIQVGGVIDLGLESEKLSKAIEGFNGSMQTHLVTFTSRLLELVEDQ